MAKLRDFRKWLELVLGDLPRANSLEKTGRAAGLFTVSGPGRDAPEMSLTDFSTIIALALTTAPPTKAPDAAKAIWGLLLTSVSVASAEWHESPRTYHAQMWKADRSFSGAWTDQMGELAPQIAFAFRGGVPLNFIAAAAALFDYANKPLFRFHDQDRIELIEAGERLAVRIELYQGDHQPRPVILSFENGKDADFARVRTVRGLYSESLNALADLVPRAPRKVGAD